MGKNNQIYVIEDDIQISRQIRQCIGEYLSAHKLNWDVQAVTENYESVLDRIDIASGVFNIFFLDIILGDSSNGLQLAQKIRRKDTFGYIIFITSHMEFAFPAIQYKIRALDYILKGDEEIKQKIFQCMNTIQREISGQDTRQEERALLVRTSGTDFIIPVKDIIYFETNTAKRSIILHTQDKSIEFRDTLDELQNHLDSFFYRCHRSFLINLQHVQSISKSRNDMYVTLSHGYKCLISPRYLKGLLRYERDHL
ncbi:MAG: response regulator transcription factor [Clostridiales bacterium]|nr:response regulator transcription factor [Clostridiales bacterium]